MNLRVILFLLAVVVLFLCVTGAKIKNKNMQKLVKCSVPLVLFVALMLCMSKTVEPYCDSTEVVNALNAKAAAAGEVGISRIELTIDDDNAVMSAINMNGTPYYGYSPNDLGTAGGDKLGPVRSIISGGSDVDIISSNDNTNYAACTGNNLKPVLDWACSGGGGSDGQTCAEEWPISIMAWNFVQGEIGATASGITYSEIGEVQGLDSTQCKKAVNAQKCNALTTGVVSAIESATLHGCNDPLYVEYNQNILADNADPEACQSFASVDQAIAAGQATTDPSITGGVRSYSCVGTGTATDGGSCSGISDVIECCGTIDCDYVSQDGTINICDAAAATGGQSGQSGGTGGTGQSGGTGGQSTVDPDCMDPPPTISGATYETKLPQATADAATGLYTCAGIGGAKTYVGCDNTTGTPIWAHHSSMATSGALLSSELCTEVDVERCHAKDPSIPADVSLCKSPFADTKQKCEAKEMCEWRH